MSKGKIGAIFVGLVIVIAVVCCLACLNKVPAGYVGVVYNMDGGVDGEILTQGWHIVSPTKRVTTYSIGLEQSYLVSGEKRDSRNDESFKCPTSDGKTVTVELEFSYRFDEERVASTFINFKGKNGETIKDTFIKPKVSAWTQEITDINMHLDSYLRMKFDQYGILIDTVNFTNIEVDPETSAAIQKKVNDQQELELANIEAQTAQVQANKEKQVAQIAAETAVIEAEAAAEVLRINAEAEADANGKLAASLTPELIEKLKYEQWDGRLPTVTGSGTIVSIGDLASVGAEEG